MFAILWSNEESEMSTYSASIFMAPPVCEALLLLKLLFSMPIFLPNNCTAPPIGAVFPSNKQF